MKCYLTNLQICNNAQQLKSISQQHTDAFQARFNLFNSDDELEVYNFLNWVKFELQDNCLLSQFIDFRKLNMLYCIQTASVIGKIYRLSFLRFDIMQSALELIQDTQRENWQILRSFLDLFEFLDEIDATDEMFCSFVDSCLSEDNIKACGRKLFKFLVRQSFFGQKDLNYIYNRLIQHLSFINKSQNMTLQFCQITKNLLTGFQAEDLQNYIVLLKSFLRKKENPCLTELLTEMEEFLS